MIRNVGRKVFDSVNPLVNFSVTRYVFSIGIFIAVVVFGVVATRSLGVDLLPSVNIPVVNVSTSYPGASPTSVDEEVTQVIESAVAQVPNDTDPDDWSDDRIWDSLAARLGHGQDGWELAHTHDELPVRPIDVVHGHHYTCTFPTSIFRQMLMVAGHAGDRHLTVTESTVTVRRAGAPTEHRAIALDDVPALLDELNVPLTEDERTRLLDRLADL